jgi:hypothetical protein
MYGTFRESANLRTWYKYTVQDTVKIRWYKYTVQDTTQKLHPVQSADIVDGNPNQLIKFTHNIQLIILIGRI